ncbi:hypothetical protein K523DRAFT_99577 [Schizophyllum commune Tattone D]|nr:hypothetical protein K523DRAFT_99577 [Schizophyllum commune Tattone D]
MSVMPTGVRLSDSLIRYGLKALAHTSAAHLVMINRPVQRSILTHQTCSVERSSSERSRDLVPASCDRKHRAQPAASGSSERQYQGGFTLYTVAPALGYF